MIDIARLKYDMALLGEHLKDLKADYRSPNKNPTWEEAAYLNRAKEQVTKLYVLRAWCRGRLHMSTKPEAWHDAIVADVGPGYAI